MADHDGLQLDAECGHLADLISAEASDPHPPLHAEEPRQGSDMGKQVVGYLVQIEDQLECEESVQLLDQRYERTSAQLRVAQVKNESVERSFVHADLLPRC